ncbi:7548_t:CDS:2, partial [Funneliformis geosporum]
MALAAPAVALFEWIVDVTKELIQLRHDNHDDFEFIPNNHHEMIWRTITNQLFINRGFVTSPSQYLVLAGIVNPIFVIILEIINPILAIIVYGIIDHIFAVIQEIIDPILEDTKGCHILYEEE